MSFFGVAPLRARITFSMLIVVLLVVWLITLLASHVLRTEMEKSITAQQFSVVSQIASAIDRSIKMRITSVENFAKRLSQVDTQESSNLIIQENVSFLSPLFNGGIVITDIAGNRLESVIKSINSVGIDYSKLPDIDIALKEQRTVITDSLIGRESNLPLIAFITPILRSGQSQGLIIGQINLAEPNFFDSINDAKYGVSGDFLVIAPKSRRYLASSDKSRFMNIGPVRGVNPLFDRHMDGQEGSGIEISSRGVLELASAKQIPSVKWVVASVLPAEEAFTPISQMQESLTIAALGISVLVSGLIWWWLQVQFHPLSEASNLLRRMGAGLDKRQLLPVHKKDEIGCLSSAFNELLIRTLAEEERAAEHAANERLGKIVSRVPGCVFLYRVYPDGRACMPFASEAFIEIFGILPSEVQESTNIIREMIHPEDKDRFLESRQASTDSLSLWRIDYRNCRSDGVTKWLRLEAMPEQADGVLTWYGFIADITEVKKTDEQLRIAATTFQTSEGMFIADANAVILRVNKAFCGIFGYSQEEVTGHTLDVLYKSEDLNLYQKIIHQLTSNGRWQGEVTLLRKNRDKFPARLTITAVRDNLKSITHFVCMLQDITSQKATEEEIYHLAYFDSLTKLSNRRLLHDRLRQAVATTSQNGLYGALLFINLDGFNKLNDMHGYHKGDEFLVEIANRLTGCARECDTVSRLGSDEFALMIQGLDGATAAEKIADIANKVLEKIKQPYNLGGEAYHGSCGVGVALFSGEQLSVDEILKRADLAMHQAKSTGRDALRFFDHDMQARINHRSMMERDLHRALKDEEFCLYYQPQIDRDGNCIGVEALIRWQHPTKGFMSPAEFIPLAEENGLIQPIGRWVIDQACRSLSNWSNSPLTQNLIISINVSAKQFRETGFVKQITQTIQDFGINPARLKIELTESTLVVDIEEAIAKMSKLKKQGIGFSLDDFGTGYSSLSYLKRLPVDQVKIDRAFVNDILTDPNDAAICNAIIALGKSLNIYVIAEGVETDRQWERLCNEGCAAVQGYLFARPMSESDFIDWLHLHCESDLKKALYKSES